MKPCPTLCDPTDYTVHGILQARTLEWVAFPFSRGSSPPRDQIQVSCIAGGFFTSWATREAPVISDAEGFFFFFFMCFMSIYMPSLEKYPYRTLTHFSIGFLVFLIMSSWAVCLFWRWIPCGHLHLQTFISHSEGYLFLPVRFSLQSIRLLRAVGPFCWLLFYFSFLK